ncbi:hypothetical protein BSO19_19390 [Escherichia coli]|uniref:hypothetical protein n=1 Tax=Escherichia coli TaxID=562 RepID=UPI00092975A0|nr:hypothetical protein [Escherichia coli]OJZ30299.1 hypothetical protein BSO19_19390 [Escherichia coli]
MLTSKEAKNNANNHSLQACQSGIWRSMGHVRSVIRNAAAHETAYASCQNGETLLGGGGHCDFNSKERVKGSYPAGNNGWQLSCPSTTAYAYAICALP